MPVRTIEVVCGYGLFDENWNLRGACRFPKSHTTTGPFDWSVTRLDAEVAVIDNTDQWLDVAQRRCGPFTITQIGLLREDATPIDAREIEAIVVPNGCRLGNVFCNVKLTVF
jgi:hypothetical protein